MHAPGKRLPDLDRAALNRRALPWIVLLAAALFFATRYFPGYFLSAMDTETIVLPLFYHDVVVLHHPVSEWSWGGFSALFPDVTTFFVLNTLFRDGSIALQLLLILFFLAWVAESLALMRVLQRPHPLALGAILLLLWVGLACNFTLDTRDGAYLQNPLFQPIYHSGTGLFTLLCLTLLLAQVSGRRDAGFWWLFALAFMGGISDVLFVVVFILPALAATGLLAALFPREWKKYLALGLNLLGAGIAAFFLGPYCFPVPLATRTFIQFDLDAAHLSFSYLLGELADPQRHFYVFLVALDVLTFLAGIVALLFLLLSRRRKEIPPVVWTLLAFSVTTLFLDWFAALFSGDYGGIYSNRYLTVALVLPLFLLAFGLHALIPWRRWLEVSCAAVVAALTIGAAFLPLSPSGDYADTEANIPFLKTVMARHHINGALSDYWRANLTTFLSQGQVPLRAATGDGNIYRWFSTLDWFGAGHPVGQWPHFRLIYMPDQRFRDSFGPPDQIIYTPNHEEVWLYSDAHSIRYSDFFDAFSNQLLDDGRTLRIDGAALPASTGNIQNHSRVAIEGHDYENFITRGPYVVLKPGHYRVTIRYTCQVPPAPDRLPTYDLLVHRSSSDISSDPATLPCPKGVPQTFTREFTVSRPNGQYEMRVYWHGSGIFGVDSLTLSWLR